MLKIYRFDLIPENIGDGFRGTHIHMLSRAPSFPFPPSLGPHIKVYCIIYTTLTSIGTMEAMRSRSIQSTFPSYSLAVPNTWIPQILA
jgi:hypothetical protein